MLSSMYSLPIANVCGRDVIKRLCFTARVLFTLVGADFPARPPSRSRGACPVTFRPVTHAGNPLTLSWVGSSVSSLVYSSAGFWESVQMVQLARLKCFSMLELGWWLDPYRLLGWKSLSLRVLKTLLYCLLGSSINVRNLDGILISCRLWVTWFLSESF